MSFRIDSPSGSSCATGHRHHCMHTMKRDERAHEHRRQSREIHGIGEIISAGLHPTKHHTSSAHVSTSPSLT
jgi:hypothetical protein